MTPAGPSIDRESFNWRKILFDGAMRAMIALTLCAGAACWILRGREAFLDSFSSDLQTLLDVLPKMALALVTAALVQKLVSRAFITRWLGDKTGLKGVAIATAVGVVTPGGPMISFPIVAAMAEAGTGRAALIAYLTSWETLGFQRILAWEFPLIGAEYSLIRTAASIPLPFIAAWCSMRLPADAPRPGEEKDA